MRFQKNNRKRLKINKSLIENAGLGIFAEENIENDEIIGEYSGELISENEANRRGYFYDFQEHSFIFNIDSVYSIDATYFGNKTRYINHKAEKASNCYTET